MSVRTVVDVPGLVWLDAEAPTADELAQVQARLGMSVPSPPPPPTASPHPSLIEEEGFTVITLVGRGQPDDDDLAEVRCLAAHEWLLTLRPGTGPALDDLGAPASPAAALDGIVRSLITGLVGLVRDLEGEVDRMEEDGGGGDLSDVRHRVLALKRTVLPQRDLLTRLGGGERLRRADPDAARGLRNSAERMGQVGATLEGLRESLHGLVADRQNVVIGRLTVITAVFLPLTFLTGFFGQNFPWLVEHIGGPGIFVVLGLLLPVACVAGLLTFFWRKRWF